MTTKHIQIFILFTAAYFLSFFFRSANAIIAPDLIREMGLNAAQLGLMTSLFFGSFSLIQIPLGLGLDRWGPRWVTPLMMVAGVVGSLVFAAAPSYPVLALGRTLIGIGMAGTLMGGLKAFSNWFPPARFSTVSGLLIGLGSTGALVAATPLGWLNQVIGWRGVFAWGALVIALVAVSIAAWSRNSPPSTPSDAPITVGGNIKIVITDHRFWRIALLAFFTNGTLLAFQGLWAGPYLFDVYRLGNTDAGNILLFISLGVTTGMLISGWLSDRWGLTRVVVFGSVIFVACQFILAMRPPLTIVVPAGCLLGFFGAFNLMLLTQPRHIFPITLTGRAITAVNVFAVGGIFFIQWWMGLIINQFPVNSAGHYAPQAYTAALLFSGICTLIVLAWYLPLLRTPSTLRHK